MLPKHKGKFTTNDGQEYKCVHCVKAELPHKVQKDIPHGHTDEQSQWPPGLPTTRMQCMTCLRWTGPWIDADLVPGALL